jgi:hypothetical protein
MRTLILVALLLTSSPPATQEAIYQWFVDDGSPPLRDVVRVSDLIVVGRLHSASEWNEEKVECGSGKLEVADVLWGDAAAGDTLVLHWRDYTVPLTYRPEGDLSRLEESDHIWLLASTGANRARAVSSKCAYGTSEKVRAWIERELAASPGMIWFGSGWFDKGAPVTVTLGYRNYSHEVREFPGMVFADSVLYVDPRVSIGFKIAPWQVVRPRDGRLVSDDSVAPLVAGPMSEVGVTFDLGAVFPIDYRNYLLSYEVAGFGKGWTRSLHVSR